MTLNKTITSWAIVQEHVIFIIDFKYLIYVKITWLLGCGIHTVYLKLKDKSQVFSIFCPHRDAQSTIHFTPHFFFYTIITPPVNNFDNLVESNTGRGWWRRRTKTCKTWEQVKGAKYVHYSTGLLLFENLLWWKSNSRQFKLLMLWCQHPWSRIFLFQDLK